MKKRKFKIIKFSSLVEVTGFIFNAETRQFALYIEDERNRLIITDLQLGANVLTALHNDLLKPTTENLIDFAKSYISKITPEQWDQATVRMKTEYPHIEIPVNKRFKL